MPRLESDLVAIRAELEKERAARTVAEQAAAVLSAQKVDLEARVVSFKEVSQQAEKLTAQLADLRVTAQASASRVEQLTAQLEDSRATAKSVEVRNSQLDAQLQAAQNDAKVALEAAAVLRGKVVQLEASKIEVSK
jgi:chromosome segregation ATPase